MFHQVIKILNRLKRSIIKVTLPMFFMIYKTIPQCENLSLLLSSPPLPHPNAFSKGTRTNCYCYTPTPLHPTPPSSLITIRAKMRNEPNQSKGVTRRLNSAICSLIQPSFCSLVLLLTFRFFPTAPLPYTRARAYTHTHAYWHPFRFWTRE